MDGSILSKKPGVINMPSWKGVINDAQANAIAAYILAGFPNTGATYDPDPAKAEDIYSAYACIDCHGQVGGTSSPSPAPNPKTADKAVPALRNPGDNVSLSEFRSVLMDGSIPAPGTKGVIFMPAWGQILSVDQVNTILPYIVDGPAANKLPPPPAASPLPLAGGVLVARPLELGVAVMTTAPSPPSSPRASRWRPRSRVRLIALAVVEVVLLTTAVLLYVRWAQFKHEPLDEWWAKRKQSGVLGAHPGAHGRGGARAAGRRRASDRTRRRRRGRGRRDGHRRGRARLGPIGLTARKRGRLSRPAARLYNS